MSQTQIPNQFTPGQTVTLRAGGMIRYAIVSKVRWSKTTQEHRYVLRVLCGDHSHPVTEVPESQMRMPRTLGEPTHLDTQHANLGRLERAELDGVEVEGIRMPDGTLVFIP